tara:strand:+ start:192 stop:1376 length:1185 start_codon:yes stop_codon:yes gene_type:complete
MKSRAFLFGSVLALGCLCASTALAYKTVGFRWASEAGPIVYRLDPAGSDDITDGSDHQRIEDAFQAWGCAEGTNLRFSRGPDMTGPGSSGDGLSSVFWIENEAGLSPFGLTENNVAVTINNVIIEQGATVENQETDIILNGVHFQWNSQGQASGNNIPIFPIMLSHIGTMVGLDQSCTAADDPQCPGEDQTILKWFYDYSATTPLPDDVSGLQSLYPADDDSQCEGPFRQGERCENNCDCIGDMVCIPGIYDYNICAPQCTSDANNCPPQFACLFGAKGEDDIAKGTCVQVGTQQLRPIGSYCEVNTQCENNSCLAVADVGRSICRQTCSDDGDCSENTQCLDGVCIGFGPFEGIGCDEEPPSGCACTQNATTDPSAALLLGILFWGFRKRRRP